MKKSQKPTKKTTKRKYTRRAKNNRIEITGMKPKVAKGLYEALARAVFGGK